uniref:Amino acid transporter transmembrane domain-containing protein n=1 Tax=Oryza punctata TaxID=4537 RepID=A0A0E0JQG8_ORYPU
MTPPASTGKSAGAGEVEEPLLPEFSGGGHGASVCGAVFNVSTSIIGAGIMSIPAVMRVLGVLPALVLIAAVAALSNASVEFMLRYTGWDSGPPSYAGIMGDAFGRAGAKALNVCIAFTTTGTLVVYLIIIGKPTPSRTRCSALSIKSELIGQNMEINRVEHPGWRCPLQGMCCLGAQGQETSTPVFCGSCSERSGGRRGSSSYWSRPSSFCSRSCSAAASTSIAVTAAGDSGAAEAPLLPEQYAGAGALSAGASVLGAVFNVSTSVVGAGIMLIPAAMRVLGVAPTVAVVVGVALLANAAVDFMLRYTRGPSSYAALMGHAFGRVGAALLNVFVAFNAIGTLTVYLIIIGDVMSGMASGGKAHDGVLTEWFGQHWWTGREAVLVAAAVLLLPLVLRKRVDSLKFTSAVSILLAVVFMLISLGIAVYALFSGTAKMPRMLPDFSRLSSPFELFTAVPIIVVAFTFHFNVHPIRAELRKTSDMKAAVRISLVLCSAIYAAVGFFGFLLFGDATMADMLANFDRSSGAGVPQSLNDAARLSYALHLVLVFPLLHFSLRVNVDELLFPGRRPLATDTRRFVALTAVLMAVLYALAIAIPSIWTLFEYSGSTFAVCISDAHGIAKRNDKALAATMITLAVITSSIAIASNVMSSIRGKVEGGHAAAT